MTIEMIEIEEFNMGTKIKVIGVGGGAAAGAAAAAADWEIHGGAGDAGQDDEGDGGGAGRSRCRDALQSRVGCGGGDSASVGDRADRACGRVRPG